MKVCPDCSTTYPDDFLFCPLDAKALLQLQPAAREAAETRDRAASVGSEPRAASEVPDPPALLEAADEDDDDDEPAGPAARLGATVLGRYALERRLGGGAMAEVFEAQDHDEPGRWAVKVLRRDRLAETAAPGRFLAQAEPLTALRHPGLAAVREVGELEDGSPCVVTEVVQGTSALELPRPVPLAILCRLGREVAEALAALHAWGTIHGDLKPRHIVHSRQGRWKLLDAGLMPILEVLTEPGTVTGAAGYVAPEGQRTGRWADPRADLYALGAVLHELLSGRLPAPERPGIPVLRAGPRIPEALHQLVFGLLAPEGGPASAQEAAEILAAVEAEIAGPGGPVLPLPARGAAPRAAAWPAAGLSSGRLEAEGKSVTCVAFSPKGRLLASAGRDGLVRLWDVESGQPLAELAGHEGPVQAVAFSPAAPLLASGGRDGTVRFWDPRSGKLLATLAGHSGPVHTAAFCRDGWTLVTSGSDEVWAWDTMTGQPRRTIGSSEPVTAAALSPSGREVVYGTANGMLEIVDLETLRVRIGFRGHREAVTAVAFSADGTRVASGSVDRSLRLWSTESGERTADFKGHPQAVSALAFHPAGEPLASAGLDGAVRLWDPATGALLETLTVPAGCATSVAFSPAGNLLAAGTGGPSIEIWG